MRSRTARVMTTLMRNGRDRRSENPSGPTRYLSACCCPGPISGSHQGQQPLRLHRNRGNPPSENRPYTWLHPNASQKVRFALAPRAPSIHGPERRLLPAPTWSRLGAKQTQLEVARMTRMTQSNTLRPSIDALQKDYSITSSTIESMSRGISMPSARASDLMKRVRDAQLPLATPATASKLQIRLVKCMHRRHPAHHPDLTAKCPVMQTEIDVAEATYEEGCINARGKH